MTISAENDPIAEAVASLDELDQTAVHEHPAAFEAVHRVLRDALIARPPGE